MMNKMILAVGLAASTLALGACAESTPYAAQSASSTQGKNGYSSEMLAQGKYRVMFSGNRLTSRSTVEDYLLYRAAQLTQQKGYTGFTVVRRDTDKTTSTDVDTYAAPAAGVGTFSTFSPYYGFYGSGFGTATYDPYVGGAFPGGTVDIDRTDRYDAMAVIQMYRGNAPSGPQPHFDASQVIQRLQSTVKMPS